MNKKIILFSLLALSAGTAITLSMQDDAEYKLRNRKDAAELNSGEGERGIGGAIAQMYALRADINTGEVDLSDVKNALTQINNLSNIQHSKALDPLEWIELGPDNVGGRTRAILIDNKNNKTLYAGGVGGGLFKSVTSGTSWSKINGNDELENMAVNCITQIPSGYVYFGTGELTFTTGGGRGNTGVVGRGIYRSRDGENFKLLPSTDAFLPGNSKWAAVNFIAADPIKDRVYAALNDGLYYTDSASTTWTKIASAPGTICKEIKVASDGTVLAVFGNALFLSDDGDGISGYENVSQGDISTSNNRLSIAISPKDKNYMYCMASKSADSKLLAIYQSKNKGDTWSVIGQGGNPSFDPLSNPLQGQGYYNNVIAVYPDDNEKILVGGVELYSWTASAGWQKQATLLDAPTNNTYVHADKHVIIFDSKTTPATLYIGNDGGVFKSTNGGSTFVPSNKGFNVTQFYAVAGDERGRVLGGTQDNGTQLVNQKGNTKIAGIEIFGGDGFYSEISTINNNALFVESYNGTLSRSLNNGLNFGRFFDEKMIAANAVTPSDPTNTLFRAPFNTPYLLWENKNTGASKFFMTMDNSVWMTREALNFGKTPVWYKIATYSGSPQTIEYNASGNMLYVGTFGGSLYRVRGIETGTYDTASSWVASANGIITESLALSTGGRSITGIAVDPRDSNKMVVTLGNYSATDYVFKSSNAADSVASNVTFSSIQGALPRMPVYDVIINMHNSNHIVLGTEYGVFASINGGSTWKEQNTGMARVATYMVRQYEFHPGEGPVMFIATHGRGIFRSNSLMTGMKENAKANLSFDMNVYPNPATESTNIQFNLDKASTVDIKVISIQGKIVYSAALPMQPEGSQQIPLNTSAFSPGTYFVSVEAGQKKSYSKFIVIR